MGIKIVTIGGGSSYTPELMEGFIKRYDELPIDELWLVDVEEGEHKLNVIYDLCIRMVKEADLPLKLYKTLDRREAIKDADFVTTQFRVGQLDARYLDESIPAKYGVIGQETNGPGGMFKALRTIPVVLDIVKDVEEVAPNAWIINFTNPSGIVTEAVNRYTDFKKFIGVCNVPIGMRKKASQVLNVNESKCQMDVFGLNHMVFMNEFLVDGESRFEEYVDKLINKSGDVAQVKNVANIALSSEFVESLNLVTCPYHRYYFKEKEMLTIEMGEYYQHNTRAEAVKRLETELFELYKDKSLKVKPHQLDERGGAYYSDAACEVINAIYNNKNNEHYVSFKNNGHIENIDKDWVIEMTVQIGREGVKPVERIKNFDTRVLGLIHSLKSYELLTCEAAVEGDYKKALLAMTINPLVHSDEDAKVVLDEMLEAHRRYLPQFN